MSKKFTKADLKNVDFEATRKNHYGFFSIDDVIGYFEAVLKDGRKFACNQNLNRVFTIHSDKYGDIEGDMFAKMAADLIGDNDKFIAIIKGATIFAQNVMGDYTGEPVDPQPKEILHLTSIAIIEKHGFNSNSLAIKMLEMGLDKNIGYVTIEPIDE